jgi:DnaJ-class molecular chaperone
MPKLEKPDERGDLIMNFRVLYPISLSKYQKQKIQDALKDTERTHSPTREMKVPTPEKKPAIPEKRGLWGFRK